MAADVRKRTRLMDYSAALEFLLGLQRFGLRLGLDVTREFARRAGVSCDGPRFVHVAGTNGKGSTCAFIEAMERAAGRRVGLYTSPHLVSFRERIQLDRVPIPEVDVARWVTRLRDAAEGLDPAEHPTFFEWVTVLALGWFQERDCELVIWETGLGGRLDATNVVTPCVSVITNIGWDHMQWLGETLPEIAREKAGIIKPGRPVLTATADPEALRVIEERARELSAPFRRVTLADEEAEFARRTGPSLSGEHQVLNAALAVATVRTIGRELPVSLEAQAMGLSTTRWPGRFQRIRHMGHDWVLDGAHNRPAFEVLARTLAREFPGQELGLLIGLLGDKDARAAVELLGPLAGPVLIVPVQSSRAGDPAELADLFRQAGGSAAVLTRGWEDARSMTSADRIWVVTGSLYLVGEALESFGAADSVNTGPGTAGAGGEPTMSSERGLNDWNPKP